MPHLTNLQAQWVVNFIEKTRIMRAAQTQYFRTRAHDALMKAFEAEKAIDELLNDMKTTNEIGASTHERPDDGAN